MGGVEVEREGAKNGKSRERKDGRNKGRQGEEERVEGGGMRW